MNISKHSDNKWYCDVHKCLLQVCTNHTTKDHFLKCPFNKEFDCGTVDTGLFDPEDYEYYLPNYNVSITSDMAEQLSDDDIDYFHSDKYDF